MLGRASVTCYRSSTQIGQHPRPYRLLAWRSMPVWNSGSTTLSTRLPGCCRPRGNMSGNCLRSPARRLGCQQEADAHLLVHCHAGVVEVVVGLDGAASSAQAMPECPGPDLLPGDTAHSARNLAQPSHVIELWVTTRWGGTELSITSAHDVYRLQISRRPEHGRACVQDWWSRPGGGCSDRGQSVTGRRPAERRQSGRPRGNRRPGADLLLLGAPGDRGLIEAFDAG